MMEHNSEDILAMAVIDKRKTKLSSALAMTVVDKG